MSALTFTLASDSKILSVDAAAKTVDLREGDTLPTLKQ